MIKIISTLLLTLPLLAQGGQFQQFMITPYTTMGDTTPYAGIIYFAGSFNGEHSDLICRIKENTPNQLQMVDQEGGLVVRISDKDTIPTSPSKAKEVGLKRFKQQLNGVAHNMARKCINTNLAPVADTNYGRDSYNRAYSEEPEEVNTYAQAFATAMRNNGIAPTWKHFPGYSQELRNMTNLDYKHIKYYKNGFKEGLIDSSSIEDIEKNMQAFKNNNADIVMLNYSIFENISNEPILFNQTIIDSARQLQPNSLIMSDDISWLNLTDKKILYLFNNVDLFLFTDYRDTVIFNNKLEKLYKDGLITDKQIQDKIIRYKQWKSKQK